MLNKDEYNQEDYNDYYRQETQGAELHGSSNNKDGEGAKGKLIGLLLLIALAIAGYFGYKMIDSSNDTIDTSLQVSMDNLPQSVQNEPKIKKSDEPIQKEQIEVKKESSIENSTPKVEVEQETPKEKTVQNEVSDKVQQAIASSTSKMSPEEVATIISAVMKQINQEQNSSNQVTTDDITQKDKELMNTLSTTEVDSVSNDLENALENVDINEKTHIDNSKKQVDVYNKVNVQNAKGTDSLSQLSAQISNEIENAAGSTTTTNEEDKKYSSDIKKEVVFRKKEMRIIIVRKGDTLGKLAKRAYGNVMEYKRIYKANPEITRPDRIYIGQKIRIPN